MGTKLMCPNANGWFEYWRAFSSNTTSACFSLIIIIVYYNIKETQWLSWLVRWHAGIGTWVRFPGPPYFFHNFSCNMFLRSASSRDHHTTPSPGLPRAQKFNLMATNKRLPCASVHEGAFKLEKSTWPTC